MTSVISRAEWVIGWVDSQTFSEANSHYTTVTEDIVKKTELDHIHLSYLSSLIMAIEDPCGYYYFYCFSLQFWVRDCIGCVVLCCCSLYGTGFCCFEFSYKCKNWIEWPKPFASVQQNNLWPFLFFILKLLSFDCIS